VQDSDVVVHARVVAVDEVFVAEAVGARRPLVRARVLEALKGEPGGEEVRFAQHGHGVAPFGAGEEVVLFLRPADATRELAPLAAAGLRFVSLQEHDARWALDDASRALVLDAVRAYVGLVALAEPAARREAFRRATLAHLASPEERVAFSALRDLVFAGAAPVVGADDVAALAAVVDDAQRPVAFRLALLAELERRALLDGSARRVAWLRSAQGAARVAVARACGADTDPEVTAALAALAGGAGGGSGAEPATVPRHAAAAEAAVLALGTPGRAGAEPALATALAGPSPRLRMAAIRALGRLATPAARAALAGAAATHPDPATRRRAEAELVVLQPSQPTTRSPEP
jgi:hypothetical protein